MTFDNKYLNILKNGGQNAQCLTYCAPLQIIHIYTQYVGKTFYLIISSC